VEFKDLLEATLLQDPWVLKDPPVCLDLMVLRDPKDLWDLLDLKDQALKMVVQEFEVLLDPLDLPV